MKKIITISFSSLFVTVANAAQTWTCAYVSPFDKYTQVLIQFHLLPPNLVQERPKDNFKILQNNEFGIIATSSIAGMEKGQVEPTVGAATVVINKRTGKF